MLRFLGKDPASGNDETAIPQPPVALPCSPNWQQPLSFPGTNPWCGSSGYSEVHLGSTIFGGQVVAMQMLLDGHSK